MSGFTTHSGKIAVLNEDQIDTDRIIPARFLSRVEKSGYGELLFSDVRNDSFVLDQLEANGASILVVGTNFGCGSSREHAVWAIQQAGFECVIARREAASPGFSDIFRGNSANCGLLLIELDPSDHEILAALPTGSTITIDLPNQVVTFGEHRLEFQINEANKLALIEGLDLIGTTMLLETEISAFESKCHMFVPASLEKSHA